MFSSFYRHKNDIIYYNILEYISYNIAKYHFLKEKTAQMQKHRIKTRVIPRLIRSRIWLDSRQLKCLRDGSITGRRRKQRYSSLRRGLVNLHRWPSFANNVGIPDGRCVDRPSELSPGTGRWPVCLFPLRHAQPLRSVFRLSVSSLFLFVNQRDKSSRLVDDLSAK